MPWEHNLLASVFTTSLNAPTFSRAYLSHNHYINSLCQFCVFYWSYNTLLLAQTFMQGAFETLTDVSPCLWVGSVGIVLEGYFHLRCAGLIFRGGGVLVVGSLRFQRHPMNKPFFPCLLSLVQPAMLSSYQMQHCVEKHSSVQTTITTQCFKPDDISKCP